MSNPTPPPLPVQPIPYSTHTNARPGSLTAIGTLSIVLSCLSFLASAAAILFALFFLAMSNANRTLPRPTPLPATPTPVLDTPSPSDALPPANRAIIVSTISRIQPLSPARLKQLNAILSQSGRKILPLSGPNLSPKTVEANITNTGTMPPSGSKPAPNYIIVGLGRIELADDHATFYPNNGRSILRASADPSDTSSDDTSPTPTDDTVTTAVTPSTQPALPRGLTPAETTTVLTALESRIGKKLTPSETSTISSQLQNPTQALFDTSPTAVPLSRQIIAATRTPQGHLSFNTSSGGVFYLQSNGTLTVMNTSNGFNFFPKVTSPAILSLCSSAASLLLSILLFIAGILVLRNSLSGRKLHLTFAYLKLPISLLSLAATIWLWTSFTNGLKSSSTLFTTTPTFTYANATLYALPAAIGLLYPLALLITFHTKSIREYYASARNDRL